MITSFTCSEKKVNSWTPKLGIARSKWTLAAGHCRIREPTSGRLLRGVFLLRHKVPGAVFDLV